MISFIRGTLVGSDSESALIEVNGIGYRVAMSYHALSSLGSKGDEVLVLTYLYVREDALVLYGFVDEEERSLFERLITVSGIGPKVALSALSRFKATEQRSFRKMLQQFRRFLVLARRPLRELS